MTNQTGAADPIAAIANALKELPGGAGTDDEAAHIANNLGMMGNLAKLNRVNAAGRTIKKNGRAKELHSIAKAARDLVFAIRLAHGDTLDTLRKHSDKPPEAHDINAEKLLRACVAAIDAEPEQSEAHGRPAERVLNVFADILACEFARVTGRNPAMINPNLETARGRGKQSRAEGPFVAFVESAFTALGFDKKRAASQARAAAERYRQGLPIEYRTGLMTIVRKL